ncbi:hypothetical protein BVRB_9g219210 isoform B [Beta vulgaris subsp. vulgaris]|nr:hypothetical protein BVRB_9g219210 isoform B [Beta vulgaris subsp. vulgaris]
MEEKTAKSETHLPNLPDDLIVEQILARLPNYHHLHLKDALLLLVKYDCAWHSLRFRSSSRFSRHSGC